MVRVAILGKMASGKSTVADIISKKYPGTRKVAIAAPIKQIAKVHFGMKKKDRRLLQIIGNTGRILDPFVWVNKVAGSLENGQSYVIDDVRFKNEVETLRRHGFKFLYLDVPKQERISRLNKLYGVEAANHVQNMEDISETQLKPDDADVVWENINLQDVESKVLQL